MKSRDSLKVIERRVKRTIQTRVVGGGGGTRLLKTTSEVGQRVALGWKCMIRNDKAVRPGTD